MKRSCFFFVCISERRFMEDAQIVQLFFERSEEALIQTQNKYEGYCRSIAGNVLADEQDALECFNDCLLRAWNSIPPARPDSLRAYLGKITRNLAIDRLQSRNAAKRGGGEALLVLDELAECVSGGTSPEDEIIAKETSAAVNRFLEGLDPLKRKIFVRRYWYMDKTADIAERYGLREAGVRTTLFRLRAELKEHLSKEGIEI